MLRGLQQLSVRPGLRRESHLTGFGDVFIPAEPEVFARDLWHFRQTGLGNAAGAAGLGSVMFNKVIHGAKENSPASSVFTQSVHIKLEGTGWRI